MKKNSIVLENIPEDLGVKLYGFGKSTKKEINAKTGERKQFWRSPGAIYLYVVAAFLVFWFLYTVITDALEVGVQAITSRIADVFALVVCLLIIFLSVFKLWGKFARFALRHNLVKNGARAEVADSAEMMENYYEKMDHPDPQPVFEVYEEYIRVTDGADVKVLRRSGVKRIIAYQTGRECLFSIVSYNTEFITCKGLRLPLREAKKLKNVFGASFEIQPLYGPDDEKGSVKSKLGEFFADFDAKHIGGLVMGLIAVAAGGGVIALHYTVAENIPAELGAFFITVGVLVVFTAFDFVPVVKVFIIPLFFGCVFAVFPILICLVIDNANNVSLPFSSLQEFLTSFNPLYCGAAFLESLSVPIIISAFVKLVKYIKYGEE